MYKHHMMPGVALDLIRGGCEIVSRTIMRDFSAQHLKAEVLKVNFNGKRYWVSNTIMPKKPLPLYTVRTEDRKRCMITFDPYQVKDLIKELSMGV